MDRQEMIDKIYEVIADKEPTMGCKVYDSMQDKFAYITHNNRHQQPDVIYEDGTSSYVKLHKEYIKIIGHPVMIGDVIEWVGKNIEPTHGLCGECGAKVGYQPGQETSHPGCGQQRDFPPQHFCTEDEAHNVGELHFTDLSSDICGTLTGYYYNPEAENAERMEKRKPIEDQSEECIEYIYNLINQGKN